MKDFFNLVKSVFIYVFSDVLRAWSYILLFSVLVDFCIGVDLILKFAPDDLKIWLIIILFSFLSYLGKNVFEYLRPFL